MLDLNDPKWQEFNAGYRIPYDAAVPLRQLEKALNAAEVESVLDELWNELHHQGDVDVASYLSVPHLIRIAKEKEIVSWSLFELIAVIEIQRHKNNPAMPAEYLPDYLLSLNDIPGLVMKASVIEWDLGFATCALSALAAAKGQIGLAAAILNLDSEEEIEEFLEKY